MGAAGFATMADQTYAVKRTSQLLRESEERFRALFEEAPVAYHEIDRLGIVLRVNRAECALLGIEPAEILGKPIWGFVAEEQREISREAIRRKVTGEQPLVPFQREYVRRDGAHLILEIHENLIRDTKGIVVGIRSAMLDVTERKRAEDALRASEKRYRLLFHRNLVGVSLSTLEGRIVDCNQAFGKIFGFASRPEPLTRPLADLYLHPAYHQEMIARLKKRHSVAAIEIPCRRSDGTPIWTLSNASLILGEDGATSLVQITVIDITERKRAEDELRELSGRLLRLQHEERRRLARELHDSTAQKLFALTLNLASLKKPVLMCGPRSRKALADSSALADLCLREIRTMSHLLHPPELGQMGLAATLRAYVEGFANRSGLQIHLDMPARLARLQKATQSTLFLVVQEGLTNVFRHSGSPRAKVRVTSNSSKIILEVVDQGRGIAPNVIRKIHENGGGLGVGVQSMRERVEQLGGRFEINSRHNGTTVRAELPIGGNES